MEYTITKSQLSNRSLFELIIGILYNDFRNKMENFSQFDLEIRNKSKKIQSMFKDLVSIYNWLVKREFESVWDEIIQLGTMSDSFKINEKLNEIIKFLGFNSVIKVPQYILKDTYYLDYFEDKLQFEFYDNN